MLKEIMKIVTRINSRPLNVFSVHRIKKQWNTGLPVLHTEPSMTQLPHGTKNHKIFMAHNTHAARVGGPLGIGLAALGKLAGLTQCLGVGWVSAKATGATWVSSKCLSSSPGLFSWQWKRYERASRNTQNLPRAGLGAGTQSLYTLHWPTS